MESIFFDIRLIFAILNGKVSAAISRSLTDHFNEANVNLTPDQWTVLMHLDTQNSITQQDLCNAIFKHKPSMTRLIDTMEAKGLVSRREDKTDRRKKIVSLTGLGREVLDRSQKVAVITLRKALAGIPIEDLRISQEVLKTIFKNTSDGKLLLDSEEH
ncbi:MAG: MarR family transcriptional regulator [Bacteroidales bacterium]|nr:MarR family transcriptional regulator [Bacteroidales bacterium]